MSMRFEGGRELARALRELPAIVAAELLETAVLSAGGILRAAAAAKVPRGEIRRRPGTIRLADSLQVKTAELTRSQVVVEVGTKVPYAHLIEYGHQIVPRGPSRRKLSITTVRISKSTGRQVVSVRTGLDPGEAIRQRRLRGDAPASGFVAARPFLRPAFDENTDVMLRRISEVLGKGIEFHYRRLTAGSAHLSAVA